MKKLKISNCYLLIVKFRRVLIFRELVFIGLLCSNMLIAQQKNPSRVLLQGFYWDFRNDYFKKANDGPNEPDHWYNYQATLANRLASEFGIDAIWTPPGLKTDNVFSNGYNCFDHYDLGDKFQKGHTRTKLGTKDEYLRMVGVMHANNIDVIQDIVLNHVDGAGSATGAGGIDPNSWIPGDKLGLPDNCQNSNDCKDNYKYKNFRYVSYSTPVKDESANDYLSRSGRFFKNWQNFHPNPGDNCSTGDICSQLFGPDICYFSTAIGESSNAIYNPKQSSNWMYDNMAKWIVWYKKQTGFDGVRLDAVKHFEQGVTQGLMDELQSNAGWANGGNQMFAVGEYVSTNKLDLDDWANSEANRSGTFDFSLRDKINLMVTGNGFFDMDGDPFANPPTGLLDFQQGNRDRTVPFVNNHDTFRPRRNKMNGKYEGWFDGFHDTNIDGTGVAEPDDYPNDPKYEDNQELLPHIDPRFNKHLAGAYAIICAVDGTPQIFFEDLFDIGTTGSGFNNNGTAAGLPARKEIANIIKAHKEMGWKDKDANQNYLYPYLVRTSLKNENPQPFFNSLNADDVIVIERGGRALIAINDNEANEGEVYVTCNFPVGTSLMDYSGQYSPLDTRTVEWHLNDPNTGIKRVKIKVPPADPASNKYGYAIWAPVGLYNLNAPFVATQRETTQEWELANDLGDSNPKSLIQGGALNSIILDQNFHPVSYVGRIFVEQNKDISIEAFRGDNQSNVLADFTISITSLDNSDGDKWSMWKNTFQATFVPKFTGWYSIYVEINEPFHDQKHFYVKATYTAPKVVDLSLDNANVINQSEINSELKDLTISVFPNPTIDDDIRIHYSLLNSMNMNFGIYDSNGNLLYRVKEGYVEKGDYEYLLRNSDLRGGTYYYRVETEEGSTSGRFAVDK